MKDPRFAFITTFGLGHMKPASGSWGSLPPPIIAISLMAIGLGPVSSPWIYNGILALILIAFSAACIIHGDHAEARFGRKDPGQVVADETAAQCIPLMFLPLAAVWPWWHAVATVAFAFVAFRIFDILKPWPANGFQRIPGGWGILLDDLVAALYALVAVQVVSRLLWSPPLS